MMKPSLSLIFPPLGLVATTEGTSWPTIAAFWMKLDIWMAPEACIKSELSSAFTGGTGSTLAVADPLIIAPVNRLVGVHVPVMM